MNNLLEETIEYIGNHPRPRELAKEAGVSYEWLLKVKARQRDPRLSYVQKILNHKYQHTRKPAREHVA